MPNHQIQTHYSARFIAQLLIKQKISQEEIINKLTANKTANIEIKWQMRINDQNFCKQENCESLSEHRLGKEKMRKRIGIERVLTVHNKLFSLQQ